MVKKEKYKITNLDRLKAVRKANREILVFPKPVSTTDKKKKKNKKSCRQWEDMYFE